MIGSPIITSTTGGRCFGYFHSTVPAQQETVIVHQTKVFAGATMEFQGAWTVHPQFGRQFRAKKAIEKKPATTAALEKYLGSGLIHGVGPKTAGKIVAISGENLWRYSSGISKGLLRFRALPRRNWK